MRIIMFTRESDATDVLPATAFLDSPVECLPPMPSSYAEVDSADVVMIDARGDLTRARALCQLFTGPMDCPPIILIVEEGGAAAVQIDWGAADFVMAGAKPAELSARLRLLRAHVPVVDEADDDRIDVGDLVIDVTAYTARLRGTILDLTYKEFELLKFLAANQGRVLTRDALLHEVWGEDYIGGSRTGGGDIRRRIIDAQHGDIALRDFGGEFIREPINVDKDAVQLLLVFLELVEVCICLCFVLPVRLCDRCAGAGE